MNFFCRLFGHTWIPETHSPQVRWNTTKDGQILTSTAREADVRHVEVCRRCSEERPRPSRRHDGDKPFTEAG